jgi:hypothetical protein
MQMRRIVAAHFYASDILDIIWSFVDTITQLTKITSICQRWNTLNKAGIGWSNGIIDPLIEKDPSRSLWFKLLSNQWKHIKSLHIPSHPPTILNVEGSLQLDALKLIPQLHTLLLSDIQVRDTSSGASDPHHPEYYYHRSNEQQRLKKEHNTLQILKASLFKALLPLIENPIDTAAITANGLLTLALTGDVERPKPKLTHLGLPGTIHMFMRLL